MPHAPTPTYRLLSKNKSIRFLALAMLREAASSGGDEKAFRGEIPGRTAVRLFGPMQTSAVLRNLRMLWWEQAGVCDADVFRPVFTQLTVNARLAPDDTEWSRNGFVLEPTLVRLRRWEGRKKKDGLTHWELELFDGDEAAARAAFLAAQEEIRRERKD